MNFNLCVNMSSFCSDSHILHAATTDANRLEKKDQVLKAYAYIWLIFHKTCIHILWLIGSNPIVYSYLLVNT